MVPKHELHHLLVGLVGEDDVVNRKEDRTDVAQPLGTDRHGSCEACLKACVDPGSSIILRRILGKMVRYRLQQRVGELTRRARGSGAGVCEPRCNVNEEGGTAPPRPRILSKLRRAYSAVSVLTMICHGV